MRKIILIILFICLWQCAGEGNVTQMLYYRIWFWTLDLVPQVVKVVEFFWFMHASCTWHRETDYTLKNMVIIFDSIEGRMFGRKKLPWHMIVVATFGYVMIMLHWASNLLSFHTLHWRCMNTLLFIFIGCLVMVQFPFSISALECEQNRKKRKCEQKNAAEIYWML